MDTNIYPQMDADFNHELTQMDTNYYPQMAQMCYAWQILTTNLHEWTRIFIRRWTQMDADFFWIGWNHE